MYLIPTKKEILTQLEKILSSQYFVHSKTLTAFLDFVVNKTLDDKINEIKEYSIGIHILNRKEGFNPQKDASVRIHAVRLRKILEKYYDLEGKDDPVIISIPKGNYSAIFRYIGSQGRETDIPAMEKKPQNHVTSVGIPLIGVMPFVTYSNEKSSELFTDGIGSILCAALSRFDDVAVLSYYSTMSYAAEKPDIIKIREDLKITHLITGSINNYGNEIMVSFELVDTSDYRILWSDSITQEARSGNIIHDLAEMVKRIAALLAGYNGIIQLKKNQSEELFDHSDSEYIDAVFWYYHYQIRYTDDIFQQARNHLEKAVQLYPRYALAHALLALLYADGVIFGFQNIEDPLKHALRLAEKALQIDPNCQQAYLTISWIHCINGKRAECLAALEKTLSINQNSSFFLAGVSLGMSLLGEYTRSLEILDKATLLNPIHRWWLNLPRIFYHLHNGELEEALVFASRISAEGGLFYQAIEAAILALMGRFEDSQKVSGEYQKNYPEGAKVLDNSLMAIVYDKKVYHTLHQGFLLSGLLEKMDEDSLELYGNTRKY